VAADKSARGRPRDPAVGDAVLRATLELLEERGYEGLRIEEVAARAGTGLGAVYRRWKSKRELVVAAVRSLASNAQPAYSDDPEADLLAGLVAISEATTGSRGRLMLALLTDPREGALADEIRSAKLRPLLDGNRERLRRLIGETADLEARADLGPALVVFRSLILDRALTRRELRDHVLPLMVGRR
jgi:AcrR family transcriptional regulator